jgi:hypothetical protein
MDWLQFIAAFVGHVAWPVVAIVMLIVLRGRLGSLADRLIELTYPGGSLKFDKLLSKAAEIVDNAPFPALPKHAGAPQLPAREEEPRAQANLGRDRISNSTMSNLQGYDLWKTTAAGKIITEYEAIERQIDDIAQDEGWKLGNPMQTMSRLVSLGKMDPEILELYRTLRAGRNVVANYRALPNNNQVVEWLHQSNDLRYILDLIRDELKEEKKIRKSE